MAGNYVYPGGTVDKGDENGEVLSCCVTGISGGSGAAGDPFADLLEYRVAAVRELFEEAGVLLAYRTDRTPFRPSNDAELGRFADYRKKLNAGQLTMVELAVEEHLFLALDQLLYYTHWITPEVNPVRFDTRFFVARHPSGQEASPDLKETTDGIWIAPRPALEANLHGTVPLSPPTLKTLEDVARFNTLDSFLSSLQGAERKPPVVPVSVTIAGETVLIYPWDPEYEACKRGVTDQIELGAAHGRPSTPSDNTTRLVYRRGLWLPFVKVA
jgi:8-oxo-dGTP pyrophosphatase MutT (NUDIX family)